MKVEFRTGTAADAPDIIEVIERAFRSDPAEPKAQSLRRSVKRCPQEYRVLALDGLARGVVHIAKHRLSTGLGAVLKADVGHVSIHPDCQGLGFGSAMMRHCVKWLKEEGYDIARLGGYGSFYSRFGWEPFPRRYVEFIVAEAKAGARTLDPEQLFRLPEEYPGELRPYDDAKDALQRWQVQQRFNEGRPGAYVTHKPAPPKPQNAASRTDPLKIVYVRDGLVRGYAFASELPEDRTPFQARMVVSDFAYDLDSPQAAGLLVKSLLIEADRRGIERVTARIPFDDRVVSALQSAGIAVNLRELHGAPATNMMRVVNVASTLSHAAPDLEARLSQSASNGWSGAFVVDVHGDRARVCVEKGRVTVGEEGDGDIEIVLGHAELVSLVFGIRCFAEVTKLCYPAPGAEASSALSTMFPRQAPASGPWG